MNIASSGQQIPRHCFVSPTDQGQIFHWLSTLPKTGREELRCFLLLKGKRENLVAYLRAFDGVDDAKKFYEHKSKGPAFLLQPQFKC